MFKNLSSDRSLEEILKKKLGKMYYRNRNFFISFKFSRQLDEVMPGVFAD